MRTIEIDGPRTSWIGLDTWRSGSREWGYGDTDAVVVLEALAVPGSAILTGDPDDIHALLAASGSEGRVPVLKL